MCLSMDVRPGAGPTGRNSPFYKTALVSKILLFTGSLMPWDPFSDTPPPPQHIQNNKKADSPLDLGLVPSLCRKFAEMISQTWCLKLLAAYRNPASKGLGEGYIRLNTAHIYQVWVARQVIVEDDHRRCRPGVPRRQSSAYCFVISSVKSLSQVSSICVLHLKHIF